MASGSAALRHKTTDAAARNGPLPLPTPQVFPMPCVVPESPGSSLSHHAFARYAHVSSSMYCPRPDVSRCRFSLLLRTPVSGNIPIQALTHPSRSMPSQDAWALRAATLGLRRPPTPPTTRSASVALEEAWRFSDGPMAHGRKASHHTSLGDAPRVACPSFRTCGCEGRGGREGPRRIHALVL